MKCYNYKCEFNNQSSVDKCMRPNFTQTCSTFWAEPDNKPNGLNIHQPEAEFETITISLHTRESARDFFTIMEKIEANRCNIDDKIKLTKEQVKILVKLCDFAGDGLMLLKEKG